MDISDIQQMKIEHFFRVLDNNNNGVLQPNDFTDVAKKICESIGIAEGSEEFELMIVHSYRIFIQIMTDLGKHQGVTITRDEWQKFFETNLKKSDDDPSPINGYIVRIVYYIFNLFDENRDGQISMDEYIQMFEVYGIDVRYSQESFMKLDLNDDGVLSKSELTQAFTEYFLSSDENSPGNWIFGHWYY